MSEPVRPSPLAGSNSYVGRRVSRLAAKRGYAVAVNFAESAGAANALVAELRIKFD